ncbi:MAG: MotA/TolQ/ExbB proton channel family protein [Bryobacteraceae bacterium]
MHLAPVFLPAQISLWDLVKDAGPLPMAVMATLVLISILSWTVIFSKWASLRTAQTRNRGFLRAFRQAEGLQNIAAGIQTIPISPLVSVFEFGYEEVDRQVRRRGGLANILALERSLNLGVSEEMTKLERHMNWLATTAAISPFIGLFGTVWGIIDAFTGLGSAGSASLRAVAPGIAEALIATALGLGAAIPAAVAYNYFNHQLREMGARMDDFSLEFLNMAERSFPE